MNRMRAWFSWWTDWVSPVFPLLLTESDPFPLCLEPVAKTMKSSYLLLLLCFPCLLHAGEFSSDFKNTHDRVWLGEEYWANPMEDWLVRDGRIVCARNGANRNVHLLAYGLNSDDPSASFVLSVRMGVEEKTKRGSAGFLVRSSIRKPVTHGPACSWAREWRSV